MTSPVMAALVAARMREIGGTDENIDAQIFAVLGPRPNIECDAPAAFSSWCEKRQLPWLPATPAAVAMWIIESAVLGPEALLREVKNISASHLNRGLADPGASWAVSAAFEKIEGPIDLPRSWSKEERVRFDMLPFATKSYLAKRDRERDVALRRAQNEAGDLRQKLKTLQSLNKGEGDKMICGKGNLENEVHG